MKLQFLIPFFGSKMLFRRESKQKGFTLVELIITMVIIAILSVIAVPQIYNHYVSNKILAAANIILADIRFAQSLAITEHDSTWVVFDDAQHKYGLYYGPTMNDSPVLNTSGDPFIQQLDQGHFKNVIISSLNIGNDKSISFDWSGNTSDSGTIILNNSVTVHVELNTGMVKIIGW